MVVGTQTDLLSGLPGGATVEAFIPIGPETESFAVGPGLPACGTGSSGGAKPLFDMWLLTGGGKYCILVSETHPSVDRQKALCFPGEGWVAEDVLCHGMLYDNDFWECDVHGKAKLHVDDLMKYYPRHKAVIEK